MVEKQKDGFLKLVIEGDTEYQRRQDVPVVYDLTTVAYVTRPEFIKRSKGIFDGSKSDTEIRSKLEMEYNAKGGEVLLGRLTVIDPEYAKIVHQNNRKRLIRALEIYEITGKSPSEHFHTQEKSKSNNEYFVIHIFWSNE